MSMKGTTRVAIALTFALVISKPTGADAPYEIPGEFHDCTLCHSIDPASSSNSDQFAIASDRSACPHLDLHHTLYGHAIPYPTAAPYGNPGELYVCLSCHAIDTSSGANQLRVERDCHVCHRPDLHHMLYGDRISYPTDAPYRTSAEQYDCLSCHEIVTSSGRNQFLVERDCQACHHVTDVENVIVDIKPESDPNLINIEARGVLPVAILGSRNYDVTEIDVSSLLLEEEVAPFQSSVEQGADGFLDLMLKFSSEAVSNALGDLQPSEMHEVWISGTFEDGTPLLGSDFVVTVPRSRSHRRERR
jgi:hypothetical protein